MLESEALSPTTDDQQERFVRLLARHSAQLFGFVLSLSPQMSDAEDIFQETSAALWKTFSSYQDGTSFHAWACKVAYTKAVDHRRKKLRELVLSDEAVESIASAAISAAESRGNSSEALTDCLKKLPRSDRSLVEQRYFRGKTPKQIADKSARSVHSIYRSLARVHDVLLRCVRRHTSSEQPGAQS